MKKKDFIEETYGLLAPQCAWCGRTNQLHIHHKDSKGMGGRKGDAKKLSEANENKILLCSICHSAVHGIKAIATDGFSCSTCPGNWACVYGVNAKEE